MNLSEAIYILGNRDPVKAYAEEIMDARNG
jgi:hypothetical protein